MEQFELRGSLAAPVERAWDAYTDHVGWQEWSGVKEVVLRQPGDPAPNGLGAIRVIRQAGLAIEEEVTRFEPPHRLSYRMVAGLPVRDYHADVAFDGRDGSTEITWSVRFRPLIPLTGGILRRGFERGLGDILARFCALELERA